MKKVFALLFAAALLCTAALAEDIDLSGMDLGQLMALHARVDEAIQNLTKCEVETTPLPPGVYIAGEGIAPGTYIVTCVGERVDLGVAFDKESLFSGENVMETWLDEGESFRVTVDDEKLFVIISGTAVIQKADTIGEN